MTIIKLDLIQTLALALGALLGGYALQRRVSPLRQWLIPAPVIGGVLCALISTALRTAGVVDIQLDTALQPYFFSAFFVSIGLRAGRQLLVENLPKVGLFLAVTVALAALQKVVALGVGSLVGLSRPAITASSAVLMGGAPAVARVVPALVKQGLPNAQAVAGAAAAFGLLCGGLLGGPLLVNLTRKKGVKLPDGKPAPAPLTAGSLISHFFLFTAAIGLGKALSIVTGGFWISAAAGALIVGAIVRNVDDASHVFKVELPYVNTLGNFGLSCTLVMAFMGLKVQALAGISLPLLVLLLTQLALPLLVSLFVVFPLLGRTPLAAMVAAGLPGFSVGVPADTMATLQCAQENNAPMPAATFIVPVVGAWLITLVNPYLIQLFM